MKKVYKDRLNKQRQKAQDLRSILDNKGLPHIGVEVTNITYELEKIIKELGNER